MRVLSNPLHTANALGVEEEEVEVEEKKKKKKEKKTKKKKKKKKKERGVSFSLPLLFSSELLRGRWW